MRSLISSDQRDSKFLVSLGGANALRRQPAHIRADVSRFRQEGRNDLLQWVVALGQVSVILQEGAGKRIRRPAARVRPRRTGSAVLFNRVDSAHELYFLKQ